MGDGLGGPRASATVTTGEVLRLIRDGRATTRADLAALTGLARSTIGQRIDSLIAGGLVYEAKKGRSTGGRPPTVLAFNESAGVILAADLGATHCRLAVVDLNNTTLAEVADDLDIARGPDEVLEHVMHRCHELLKLAGRDAADVRGVGLGVPGPVEFASGRPVSPPIMPGWDDVSIPERVRRHFKAPVLVDNDVNIMALGEWWAQHRDDPDLLFIKVGTGIGCGIVAGGMIHRGSQGAAGDLGHIQVTDAVDALCRCGNVGCVEAVAGGAAIARQLRALGYDAHTSRDVVKLVRTGNTDAVRLVRTAGRQLGGVLAAAVNFFNPAVIVMGGDIAHAHEQLLAGVREVVYQRSLPLATRHLRIVRSGLGDRAGVTGAGVMVIERILSSVDILGGMSGAVVGAEA
ncbi:MAG: ROK family protein [Actinomycetota bacterium]